ncbi:hypothetical protein B0H21DRAFT_886656 [Amylocystis lapponica]|nr:hypothetical protein B0H21DRAFT_886656 [Amylocystis lapponica]
MFRRTGTDEPSPPPDLLNSTAAAQSCKSFYHRSAACARDRTRSGQRQTLLTRSASSTSDSVQVLSAIVRVGKVLQSSELGKMLSTAHRRARERPRVMLTCLSGLGPSDERRTHLCWQASSLTVYNASWALGFWTRKIWTHGRTMGLAIGFNDTWNDASHSPPAVTVVSPGSKADQPIEKMFNRFKRIVPSALAHPDMRWLWIDAQSLIPLRLVFRDCEPRKACGYIIPTQRLHLKIRTRNCPSALHAGFADGGSSLAEASAIRNIDLLLSGTSTCRSVSVDWFLPDILSSHVVLRLVDGRNADLSRCPRTIVLEIVTSTKALASDGPCSCKCTAALPAHPLLAGLQLMMIFVVLYIDEYDRAVCIIHIGNRRSNSAEIFASAPCTARGLLCDLCNWSHTVRGVRPSFHNRCASPSVNPARKFRSAVPAAVRSHGVQLVHVDEIGLPDLVLKRKPTMCKATCVNPIQDPANWDYFIDIVLRGAFCSSSARAFRVVYGMPPLLIRLVVILVKRAILITS